MGYCISCKYFRNFQEIGLGLRCLNENNKPSLDNFMIVESAEYLCSHYKKHELKDRFEWDETKNEENKRKHKLGFERSIEIWSDPGAVQMVVTPDKWEKEVKGIEINIGNSDLVRGKIIGLMNNKLYTFIYTFRHNLGDMTYRIISLRRSQKNEEKYYNKMKEL